MFLQEVPEYESRPFYIFGVSYGGKMAATFANRLLKGIEERDIRCNFKGVVDFHDKVLPCDLFRMISYDFASKLFLVIT